jgi:hypothetical protein
MGVGRTGVEVGPGVGIKLGKVGVTVGSGVGGMRVGLGGTICGIGLIKSKTIIPAKTRITNPANTPIVSA